MQKKNVLRICPICCKDFLAHQSDLNRGFCRYCSQKCSGIARRGIKFCQEHRQKLSNSAKGENNSQWKGDLVGYSCLHNWVRRRKQKPLLCVRCNQRNAYDLANISGGYKRDVNDYEWLCRKCHMENDGRLTNAIFKLKSLRKIPLEEHDTIKRQYNQGIYTGKELAEKYGVTTSLICLIVHQIN